MREWCRHELEGLRQFVPDDELKKHPCIFHYQAISLIMFAYSIEDAPIFIQELTQQSLEVMLDNYGVNPEEFV